MNFIIDTISLPPIVEKKKERRKECSRRLLVRYLKKTSKMLGPKYYLLLHCRIKIALMAILGADRMCHICIFLAGRCKCGT